MQADPTEEWRRLTNLYAEMGDLEIRELASQINDLTETAQQILRDEMRKRGITQERSSSPASSSAQPKRGATVNWEPASYMYRFAPQPDAKDGPHEYTWKTPLCMCDTKREAMSFALALKTAGIDSWIEAPESRSGLDGARILVGADQLEEAKAVIAQPIPQDILDQVGEEESTPGYEIPVCPKCGEADPTLESVEPSNNWLCESCGHTWSDPVPNSTASSESSN